MRSILWRIRRQLKNVIGIGLVVVSLGCETGDDPAALYEEAVEELVQRYGGTVLLLPHVVVADGESLPPWGGDPSHLAEISSPALARAVANVRGAELCDAEPGSPCRRDGEGAKYVVLSVPFMRERDEAGLWVQRIDMEGWTWHLLIYRTSWMEQDGEWTLEEWSLMGEESGAPRSEVERADDDRESTELGVEQPVRWTILNDG